MQRASTFTVDITSRHDDRGWGSHKLGYFPTVRSVLVPCATQRAHGSFLAFSKARVLRTDRYFYASPASRRTCFFCPVGDAISSEDWNSNLSSDFYE